MTQGTPAYHDLAQRLIAQEGGSPECVCEKLREGLQKLVGPAGFDALLQRALYLARADFPLLRGAKGPDGLCLSVVPEGAVEQDPAQAKEALTTALAYLFWLLGTFVGDDLARRQVQRIWPEVPLSGTGSGAKETMP